MFEEKLWWNEKRRGQEAKTLVWPQLLLNQPVRLGVCRAEIGTRRDGRFWRRPGPLQNLLWVVVTCISSPGYSQEQSCMWTNCGQHVSPSHLPFGQGVPPDCSRGSLPLGLEESIWDAGDQNQITTCEASAPLTVLSLWPHHLPLYLVGQFNVAGPWGLSSLPAQDFLRRSKFSANFVGFGADTS